MEKVKRRKGGEDVKRAMIASMVRRTKCDVGNVVLSDLATVLLMR